MFQERDLKGGWQDMNNYMPRYKRYNNSDSERKYGGDSSYNKDRKYDSNNNERKYGNQSSDGR